MAAQDLTTVAAVRSILQKQTADVNQDAVIQSMITSASVAIMRYTDREFAPATTAAARDFEWWGGTLRVAPYDLRTVSSVVVGPDETTPVTLASTDYALYPYPSVDGVFSGVRISSSITACRGSGWQPRLVRVTGNWGFASVPSDVAQACAITVATWLRRDVAAFSTTFSLDEQRVERPEALPSQVTRMLAPWKRQLVA